MDTENTKQNDNRKEKSSDCQTEPVVEEHNVLVEKTLTNTNSTNDDPISQLDGGWGWIVVLAGFCCTFMIDGIGYSFGILLPYIMDGLEASPSLVSLGGSIQTGSLYFISIVTGTFIEKFGCRLVGITGAVVTFLGILLSSFSINIWMFLVTFGLISGIGLGFLNLATIIVVNRYFDTKRGTAQGIMFSGAGFGITCISPLIEQFLVIYHWRGTLLIISALCLQLCVACAAYRPINIKSENTKKKNFSQNNCTGNICSNRSFIIIIIGVFFNQMAQMIPTTFLGKVGISIGLPSSAVSWIYSVFGIMQILGRLSSGILVDKTRITSTVLCAVAMFLASVVCFFFPFFKTFASLIFYSLVYGFLIAFYSVLNSVMVFDSVGLNNLTNGLSIVIFIRGSSAIVGPPIAGTIFELTQDYNIIMVFAGCLLALTSTIYLSFPLYQFLQTSSSKPLNAKETNQEILLEVKCPSEHI